MTHLKFLLFAVLTFSLLSCEKELLEVENEKITLSNEGIAFIKASSGSSINYTSENRFIATVNEKGMVSANHIGETNIIVESDGISVNVPVEVQATYNYSTEPELNWTWDSTAIIRKFGEPTYRGVNEFTYYTSDNILNTDQIKYQFDHTGQICEIDWGVRATGIDFMKFITERYQYAEKHFDNSVYINAMTKSEASLQVEVAYGLSFCWVYYTPL
jgi:hypothetical protein